MASDPHQMFPVGPLAHSYQPQYNAWTSTHAAQPISVRQYPSTSSAFSASAHPDEDWTKVSDLAERRRIQNRIAQRNYRKKIKERMQFLESKAGADDGKLSKKPSKSNGTKSSKQQQQAQHQRRRSSPPISSSASLAAPVALHHPYTPPMNPEDQPFFPSPSPPAASPPPFSAYQQSYSPPSDNGFYAQHPVTTWMGTAALTTTAAPTLPPMTHFSEAYNKGNESMSFATYGDYSLGVPATASPYDSNPHVSTHHYHHHHHLQQSAPRTTALLPPLSYHGGIGVSSPSSTSSTSPATGHLAAPDLHRSRYPPPPAPTRV